MEAGPEVGKLTRSRSQVLRSCRPRERLLCCEQDPPARGTANRFFFIAWEWSCGVHHHAYGRARVNEGGDGHDDCG